MMGAIRDPVSIERYLKCMNIEPRAPSVAAARAKQLKLEFDESPRYVPSVNDRPNEARQLPIASLTPVLSHSSTDW